MLIPSTSLSETLRSTDLSVSTAESTADLQCGLLVVKAARLRVVVKGVAVASRCRATRAVLEVNADMVGTGWRAGGLIMAVELLGLITGNWDVFVRHSCPAFMGVLCTPYRHQWAAAKMMSWRGGCPSVWMIITLRRWCAAQ